MKAFFKMTACLTAFILAFSTGTTAALAASAKEAVDNLEPSAVTVADTEASPVVSADGTWRTINGNKYYYLADGTKATMWQNIDGKKYYFGLSGVMRTMWETIDGKKYYFGKTGVMRTMWQTIGGKRYYFGKTGVMRTMWETVGGKKYYFGKTGVMRTMWQTIGGEKYFFGKTGTMRQGWQTIGGKRYYFGKSGVMRKMWNYINGKLYYFGKSGIMRQGWETIGGYKYYFGKSGVTRTGWNTINGVDRFFDSDGRFMRYAAYASIISSYEDSYDYYRSYTLFDLNKDGIKELIMHLGNFEAEARYEIWTLDGKDWTWYLSELGGGHSHLTKHGKNLYIYAGHMGYYSIDQIVYSGGSISTKNHAFGEIQEEYPDFGTSVAMYDLYDYVGLYK